MIADKARSMRCGTASNSPARRQRGLVGVALHAQLVDTHVATVAFSAGMVRRQRTRRLVVPETAQRDHDAAPGCPRPAP